MVQKFENKVTEPAKLAIRKASRKHNKNATDAGVALKAYVTSLSVCLDAITDATVFMKNHVLQVGDPAKLNKSILTLKDANVVVGTKAALFTVGANANHRLQGGVAQALSFISVSVQHEPLSLNSFFSNALRTFGDLQEQFHIRRCCWESSKVQKVGGSFSPKTQSP